MRMEIIDVSTENWEYLTPIACVNCIYWEEPELSQSKSLSQETLMELKKQWMEKNQPFCRSYIKVALVEGQTAGYMFYAPPTCLPLKKHRYALPLPSKNSLFLGCLYVVEKGMRKRGIGKRLLEALMEFAQQEKFEWVETYAREDSEENPSGPAEFYIDAGFEIAELSEASGMRFARLRKKV